MITKINEKVTWKEITPGGEITGGATAPLVFTGAWRTDKPVWKQDNCKQCLLCFPVCPDSSITLSAGKREEFDFNHCKGCGICAAVCPFDAIDMIKEEQ